MSELKPYPMTADEAITVLERLAHTESKWPGTEDTLEALDVAVEALRRAQHMPTVDAVEVVRCRDCVHFGECLVTENDYCSKGERKENS